MPVVKHASVISSQSGTGITRAPWPAPTNKYYILRKVIATQQNVGSGSYLSIWDQDCSNTTPVTRGSAGGPLLQIPITPLIPASGSVIGTAPTMTVLDIDACPQEYFQAGVMAQNNVSGTVIVSVELDVV
jgi:hypothetical protein